VFANLNLQQEETKQNCQSGKGTAQPTTPLGGHTRNDDEDEPENAFDDIDDHNRFQAVPLSQSFNLLGTNHVSVKD
jgi:hypothetical protein